MAIQTRNPALLIKSLLSSKNPGKDLLNEMRFHGVYTGNLIDPAHNWGGIGFLPLAGFSSGDVAGLQPLKGKPIASWPVLRFSHVGDPGVYLAPSLKEWLPMHILSGFDEATDLKKKQKRILQLAQYLGSSAKAVEKAIALAVAGNLPDDVDWSRKLSWSLPARYAKALQAQAKKSPTAAKLAFEALSEATYFGGSAKTARELAAIVVATGSKKYGADSRFAAIEKMAQKQICGKAWYEAAVDLEKQKKPADAFKAYQNAVFFVSSEFETVPQSLLAATRRAAGQLRDSNLAALFEDFKKEDKQELENILRKYDELEAKRTSAKAPQHNLKKFFNAARSGSLLVLEKFLDGGTPVDVIDGTDEMTALHHAARSGKTAAIRFLIKRGAKIEKKCRFGAQAALHLASEAGKLDAVMALLECGANLEATNGSSNTALYRAVEKNRLPVIRFLLSEKAKTGPQGYNDESPLYCAVTNGYKEAVRLLLEAGANPNEANYDGNAPIHEAVNAGNLSIVKMLVEAGANLAAPDKWGKTPIELSRDTNNRAMEKLFERTGSKG